MIIIERLWSGVDDNYNITLLERPRTSIEIDKYIWSIFEENIVIPKNIMQSNKYDYYLTVTLHKYIKGKQKFCPYSPYNGDLVEGVTLDSGNYKKRYRHEDYVGGLEKTQWFSPQKFWLNCGNKAALISAYAENIDQHITPSEYADILFDAFASTLLFNFKKIKKEELDLLKENIDSKIISSFPFPAPFEDQQYSSDNSCLKVTTYNNGVATALIDIPSIEVYYKEYYKY